MSLYSDSLETLRLEQPELDEVVLRKSAIRSLLEVSGNLDKAIMEGLWAAYKAGDHMGHETFRNYVLMEYEGAREPSTLNNYALVVESVLRNYEIMTHDAVMHPTNLHGEILTTERLIQDEPFSKLLAARHAIANQTAPSIEELDLTPTETLIQQQYGETIPNPLVVKDVLENISKHKTREDYRDYLNAKGYTIPKYTFQIVREVHADHVQIIINLNPADEEYLMGILRRHGKII